MKRTKKYEEIREIAAERGKIDRITDNVINDLARWLEAKYPNEWVILTNI